MKRISINDIIKLSVDGVSIVFIVLTLITAANFVWWVVKPSETNVLTNVAAQNINDKLAQNIMNNAPFGIVQKKVESSAPVIADEVKVVGVYAGGEKNSIAFLLVNNKSEIAKIGDKIVSGTVKAILPNGIILTNNGIDRTIELSSGIASPNQPATNVIPNNTPHNEQYENRNEQNNTNTQNQNVNNTQQSAAPSANNRGGMDDVVAQRRKMIEQFQQNNNSN